MSESEQTTAPAENRKPKRRRRKPRRRQSNWDLRQFQVPVEAGKWRFHDFDLPLPLMRAIHALGFEYCTPIQAEALSQTLLGGDIVGKAQTGTGKTAAFLISIMAYFLEEEEPNAQKVGAPRALIVAPTRELALQIEKDAKALARFTSLNVASVVGGMDYQKQRDALGRKVDILVATPGRLLDFHEKRDVDLTQVEVLVLDEAQTKPLPGEGGGQASASSEEKMSTRSREARRRPDSGRGAGARRGGPHAVDGLHSRRQANHPAYAEERGAPDLPVLGDVLPGHPQSGQPMDP
ncbi:DEAD/DEAH box helicase [Halomonas chromatireducens]|uniref:DEAD/DEAH box helicase n=1 Tax=Halomonas chromatireducens TaxID=507626 RepID=UPI000AD53604